MSLEFFAQQPSVLRGVLSDFLRGDYGATARDSFWSDILTATDDIVFQSVMLALVVGGVFLKVSSTATAFTAFIIGVIVGGVWFSYARYGEEKVVKDYKNKVTRLERTMQRKRNFFDNSARSLLHKNPALITILAKLYVFGRFDRQNFKDALISANQLIRVYESSKIGVVLPDQIIDIAEELQRNTMNYIHSMIHSLPSTTIGDYRWQVQLDILQKVLQKIIDDIKLISEAQYEKIGPTIYNPPPDYRSGAWPNPIAQKEYNAHWDQYY
jgi:hypothetical protein